MIFTGLKEAMDSALDKRLKDYPRVQKIMDFLRRDKQTNIRLNISNSVTVGRLKYNDHGPIHARVVAFSALKALEILYGHGVKPSIMKECGEAKFEDALEVVVVAGYLHDCGNAVLREGHDLAAFVTARDMISRVYNEEITELNERKRMLVYEALLCHMGNYKSTSLEAKIVPIADGCDMEQGRARIPYERGKKDIHSMSALAIQQVRLKEGKEKPLRVEIDMDSSAGLFQIEENLIKKIKAAEMEKYIEISAYISSRKETVTYLKD